MRKKILMLMACGCLLAGSAHAQWVVTDPHQPCTEYHQHDQGNRADLQDGQEHA